MLSADDTLRKQRKICILSGNVKIYSWLAGFAALVCIASAVEDIITGKPYLLSGLSSVVLVVLNLYLRGTCRRKMRALETDLENADKPGLNA